MEVMCTVYAKSGTQSKRVSNYTVSKRSRKARQHCERRAHIVTRTTFQYFAESFDGDEGAFLNSFLHFVGTHFRIFVRKFLVHSRTVYASPQKLARLLKHTGKSRRNPPCTNLPHPGYQAQNEKSNMGKENLSCSPDV